MRIVTVPLTPKAFAPYGDVLTPPDDFGRAYFDEGLQTSRSTARPSLSLSRVRPVTSLPLEAKVLERHEFSSPVARVRGRSEEHTSELQSQSNLVCRLLLEKKKKKTYHNHAERGV